MWEKCGKNRQNEKGNALIISELPLNFRDSVGICRLAAPHPFLRGPSSTEAKACQVPNLVSALAGHVEGSRAFTRYRTIDMDMKMDLVKILEGKQ